MNTLLERDRELALLRETLRDAAEGRGSVVLVGGEAGIGKSSLVRAFVADPGTSARMLLGWCDDFLTSRTLGPFRDIARTIGGELADATERSDTGAVIEALLAAIKDPLRPTVLVLEDLHWADEATLDVVRYLGRRVSDRSAMLVLTYRDDEVTAGHPLRGVLGVLPSADVRRLTLRRLSHGAVAELASGTELDPDHLVQVTVGNPFFVTEVIRGGGGVPVSVADAVMARVRTLPVAARAAVELLSVLPRATPREEVEALVSDVGALAAAEERGLLQEDGGRLRFVHELARRAILDALPVSRRREHHGAVLDRLLAGWEEPRARATADLELGRADHAARAETGPSLAPRRYRLLDRQRQRLAILHHANELGRRDLFAEHGPPAAHDAFVAGAHRQAVEYQGLVLLDESLVTPDRLAALLLERAWCLYTMHRFQEAAAAAERAADLYEALGDVQSHARVLITCSRMYYMTDRLDAAFRVLETARLLLPRCEPHVGVELAVNEASLLHLADRHDDVVARADPVLADAEASGRADLVAHARNYLGGSQVLVGRTEEGLAHLRAAVDIARDAGWIEAAARAHMNLVEMLVLARRWTEAEPAMDEAIAFFDDHDLMSHRSNTLAHRARVATYLGDWASAAATLDGIDTSELGASVLGAVVRASDALLAVRAGHGDAASRLTVAWESARRAGSAHHLVLVACVAIEWAWMRGAPDAADPFVEEALRVAGDTRWSASIRWHLPLVRAATDGADTWIEPERTSLRGDWRGAADRWSELHMPFERALELLRGGDPEASLEALRILDDLGAGPAAKRVRALLRAIGQVRLPRGPRPATRGNPAGLTGRQLEVLHLVDRGMTNTEIADHLVVSVRTVDHHVSAAFQKLGVTNRRDAAARIREMA